MLKMPMENILSYIQVVLSIILMALVLVQRSEAGLGSAFGGDGMSMGRFVRRGLERTSFIATIAVAILFALTALLSILLG